MGTVRFRFVLAASVAAAPSWKPVARRFPGGTQRGDLINRGNLVLATR